MAKGTHAKPFAFLKFLYTAGLFGCLYLALVFPFAVAAKTVTDPMIEDRVDTPYPAPLLLGIIGWINSPPITLSELKNKVVLIEFWTSSCPYCQSTIPYMNKWYNLYHNKGLLIIGVHSPKDDWENDSDVVKNAVIENNIHYPVALDNNFETWNNYNVEAWPSIYLIDRNGYVVYVHYGASDFDVIENNIRALLGLH